MASGLVYKYLNEVWKAIYRPSRPSQPCKHCNIKFSFFMIFVVTLNPFLVFLHKMYLQ